MNVTIIHGQAHKGITYTMTTALLEKLTAQEDECREFFLPTDGPGFCVGCNRCFLEGEGHCPAAAQMTPIAQAMEWADVIVLDSPCYAMEMSGALKNLMDHLAYRWVTHRPHGAMFTKVGVVLSSSAGAPTGGVVKSMAGQLKWMGASKVCSFGLISGAMTAADLSPKKRAVIDRKTTQIAHRVRARLAHPRPSLRGRIIFSIFRRMQSSPSGGWNPTDRAWWVTQGWTEQTRPWRK